MTSVMEDTSFISEGHPSGENVAALIGLLQEWGAVLISPCLNPSPG